MFDHIVLRRSAEGAPISLGQIAEALFYYQKVQIYLDFDTVWKILSQINPIDFIELLRRPDLSAVYCEEHLATHTEHLGVSSAHTFVAISFSCGANGVMLETSEERLHYRLTSAGMGPSSAKTFIRKFFDRVPIRKVSGNHFIRGGVCAAAQEDLTDGAFVKSAIRTAIATTSGGYDLGDTLEFDVITTDIGNFITSNIDFTAINSRRALAQPHSFDPLTVAHLLTSILDARADLALSAHYGGDFVTSRSTSSIIQTRVAHYFNRAELNIDAQRQFSELTVPDAPSVAEVIDSGRRSIGELLILLDKASRFKAWLRSVNPDEGLVREYVRAMNSEAPVQGLPSKTIRYVLATTIGDIGFLAGAVAGFADTFIIEKLLGGWRPNHFVTRRLSPFLNV